MVRLCLECLFRPEHLDQLFRDKAERQYQKELLFSQLVELMMSVVLRVEPSVHAAYRNRRPQLKVSDQAVYDKLQCMELGVSQALVADSAAQVRAVMERLHAPLPAWLPGHRARVLDASHLSATQKRLKPLRETWAAALPGTVMAVYDPEWDLVTDVFLTADGHAQERTLLDDVLKCVRPNDLWIADRNLCTLPFLWGLHQAGAKFVLRQHGKILGELLGERRPCGRTATGKVYEQKLRLHLRGQTLMVRRISVVLDKPTRNGDGELHLLTNLTEEEASADQVACIYHRRWTIEGRFYEVTQTLDCEPDTLGYPKAALFAFCLALLASNAVALLRASLRAVHPVEDVQEMSRYYMALEVRQTYPGMMIALPPWQWTRFARMTVPEWAKTLREVAQQVCPDKYRKAHRGPKKKPPPKDKYKNGGHVSTYRLLLESRR